MESNITIESWEINTYDDGATYCVNGVLSDGVEFCSPLEISRSAYNGITTRSFRVQVSHTTIYQQIDQTYE